MQLGEIRFSIKKTDGTLIGQYKTYEKAQRVLSYNKDEGYCLIIPFRLVELEVKCK